MAHKKEPKRQPKRQTHYVQSEPGVLPIILHSSTYREAQDALKGIAGIYWKRGVITPAYRWRATYVSPTAHVIADALRSAGINA